MTTQPVPDDHQPGLQARFRQFLDRPIPIIFGFAVLLAIAYAAYTYRLVDAPMVAVFGYSLFLLAVVVLLLLLWQFNRRFNTTLAHLRAANAALHDSEARQRAISELTAGTIYALRVGADGQPVPEWINESFTATTGYSLADLQGRWLNILHPNDQAIGQAHTTTLLAGQPDVCEYRIITKSGGVRWLRDYAQPQWDAEHRYVVRILGASQDITDHKRTEEQRNAIERKMLEAQKLESLVVLAGGIAHDFNNLLAIILGNADLARMELPPDSPTQELLAPIIVAVQRATTLTQQMLAYSGKGHFLIEPLDLNTLLLEMQEPIRIALGEHVTAVYQSTPDLPLIEADASQIRQAVLNLAINAAEAIGRQGGTITFRTGLRVVDRGYLVEAHLMPDLAEGRYVYLDIADTGSGMDAVIGARIFEPFFTTKFMGRGLGLAAVLGIVRGHRGAIQVQSTPEQGTTFTLLLPTLTAEQRGVEARQPEIGAALASHTASSFTPSGTVLIVDDEDAVLVLTARILKHAGFTVLTAGDGNSAVALFRTSAATVTCVLLDLMMPGMSGDRIFREIRRNKPDVRIILMSGYDEREATSHLADQRPTSFLQKPFSPEQLRDTVRRALG